MCVHPIVLKRKNPYIYGESTVQVPCNKCIDCITRYQNDWTIRLNEEAKQHRYVYFLTLTYRDAGCLVYSLDIPDRIDSLADSVRRVPVTESLCKARARCSSFYDYLRPQDVKEGISVPSLCYVHVQKWLKKLLSRRKATKSERNSQLNTGVNVYSVVVAAT